jgi:DNA-binding Lrp family transcriptional regulator
MDKHEVRLDRVDLILLELLSRDGRTPVTRISKCLAKNGESLTSRTVLNRIKRLEKYKVIQGYAAVLNLSLFRRKEIMLILLKFAPFHDKTDIDKLNSHVYGSSLCFFAAQLIGGTEAFDYACYLLCDTRQQLDSELELIIHTFGNLISKYQVSYSKIIKQTPPVFYSADIRGGKASGSPREQTDNELEEIQKLVSQSMDEAARSLAARAGFTLD